MDVLRVVAPPRIYQYIPFYDNSATHNKREDLTLATSKLNAKWGGKQPGLRDSTMLEGCIGPHAAIVWFLPGGHGEESKWVSEGTAGAVAKVCTLTVGDVDYGKFQDDDAPPFYDLNAEKNDRPMTVKEKRKEVSRFIIFELRVPVRVEFALNYTHNTATYTSTRT